MTDLAGAGLWARLLVILTPELVTLLGFVLFGLLYSIAWTHFRKPRWKRSPLPAAARRRRIQREAFWSAALPTAYLIAVFLDAPPRVSAALVVILAPLTGLLSPLAYDVFWDALWPRLRPKP